MKKPFLLFAVFVALVAVCIGQSDSVRVFGRKELVRGIYKSYQEFIDNVPSIKEKFSVTQLVKSKSDSTVIAAYFTLNDPKKKVDDSIWGFCDENFVYVKYNDASPLTIHLGKAAYWKLECLGPYSFFSVASKNVTLAGPGLLKLVTGALSTANPMQLDCFVIDPKGKIKYASIGSTEKYLASYPAMRKTFRQDSERFVAYDYGTAPEPETDEIREAKFALIKDYLLKLNEVLTTGAKD